VFRIDELGTPLPAGHKLGQLQSFFPLVSREAVSNQS
jgi:hypothetical protein